MSASLTHSDCFSLRGLSGAIFDQLLLARQGCSSSNSNRQRRQQTPESCDTFTAVLVAAALAAAPNTWGVALYRLVMARLVESS